MTAANDSNATEIQTIRNLDALTYGVEIETFGASKVRCAEAIRTVVGGTVDHGYGYGGVKCVDREGRDWKVVSDGSINTQGTGHGAEIVTPPLRYTADMIDLQEVVRALRACGAKVNSSCGIHVHVGLTSMGRTEKEQTRAVKNLANIVHKHQRHINVAVGVSSSRESVWAKPLPTEFVNGIRRANTLDKILAHYYDKCGRDTYSRNMQSYRYAGQSHYCDARYSGLNLHNLCYRSGNARTVEFRLFDATLHAGKVRAYVTFCLAMAARAANVSRTSYAVQGDGDSALGREQCRWFLKTLGLVGERFDTVRRFVCDEHFDVAESRRAAAEYRNRDERRRVAA
jgi:Putative amidoligase enzyme